jgi:Trk K+ transport system NAD-binding subunit/nucleotide-binding universal stress UspA family protein
VANRQVVVVGIGRVGRKLIRALPEGWSVAAVDHDPEKLGLLPEQHRGVPVRCVLGDATSRLVLEDAGLTPWAVLVVVTGDDRVNREVARLAREHFGVEELVCLLDDPSGIENIGLSHREAVQRFQAIALIVMNRLTGVESRGVAVGLGKGEIREVTIREGSAAVGRVLRDIRASHWKVAAVYRKGLLVVPSGDTVLETGDQVLLTGEPDVIEKVGRFFRGGEPVFPTQYGPCIGLLDGHEEEARWVVEHSEAEGLLRVNRSRLFTLGELESDDGDLCEGVGCLVCAPDPVSVWARIGLARSSLNRVLGALRVPFVVARGTYPYRKVLLAVAGQARAQTIASVAIDVTRQMEATLTVLTVVPATLDDSSGAVLRDVPRRIAGLARLHGVEVERRVEDGNPIEVIRKHAREFDLLVVGHAPDRRNTLVTPDISLFLLHDTPCSTLFVPGNAVRR